MHRVFRTLALGASAMLATAAAADTVEFESEPHRAQVVELYTSEGCSSCPPADRWISTLADDPGLWRDIVPLAFHVDYWDYLGWRDRFARAEHSQRQRSWARERAVRTVYTPGFVVDGREWRAWFSDRKLPGESHRRAGRLTVTVSDSDVDIAFEPPGPAKGLEAHVALLGFGLETDVRDGENRGRTLSHDFVVLDINTSTLKAIDDSYGTKLALPASDVISERYAIAAWVTGPGSQRALQAAGGWLP